MVLLNDHEAAEEAAGWILRESEESLRRSPPACLSSELWETGRDCMLPRMEEKKVLLWMVSKMEDLESSVAMGEREVASSGIWFGASNIESRVERGA